MDQNRIAFTFSDTFAVISKNDMILDAYFYIDVKQLIMRNFNVICSCCKEVTKPTKWVTDTFLRCATYYTHVSMKPSVPYYPNPDPNLKIDTKCWLRIPNPKTRLAKCRKGRLRGGADPNFRYSFGRFRLVTSLFWNSQLCSIWAKK